MNKQTKSSLAGAASVFSAYLLVAIASPVQAATVQTTIWNINLPQAPSSTGTLGSITVTYSTLNPPQGNSGLNSPNFGWDTSLATNGAGPFSSQSGGILGVPSATVPFTTPQSISFSANVTNPILLINFSDSNTSLDFGALSLTKLDSNNAQLSGSLINFLGSTNSFDDGIALQINGIFGPGNPINFDYIANTESVSLFDSVGFTVGIKAVPEPSSLLGLLALGTLGAGVTLKQKLKTSKSAEKELEKIS